MIIQGYFIGDAPYFPVHLRHEEFEGLAWLLADTGASRTTLLDRDVRLLGLPPRALSPAPLPTAGIGGGVRSFVLRDVEITFASDEGDFVVRQEL